MFAGNSHEQWGARIATEDRELVSALEELEPGLPATLNCTSPSSSMMSKSLARQVALPLRQIAVEVVVIVLLAVLAGVYS